MRKPVIIIYFLFIFICYPVFCESLSNIYGKVIDEETKEPILKIAISLKFYNAIGRPISVTKTDQNGEFFFKKIPVDIDLEIEIHMMYHPSYSYIDFKYSDHIRKIKIRLQKGKNLYLKPVEIERGVKLKGTVKLWDGTPFKKAYINLDVINPSPSTDYILWGTSTDENGQFETLLLPTNVEMNFTACKLHENFKSVCYGTVKKTVKIIKGETPQDLDFVVPNILTEISGRVVNINGIPLANQKVGFLFENGIYTKTDVNGHFKFKHINSGNITLRVVYYVVKNFIKSFLSKDFPLRNNEKIWLDIKLGQNYFDYKISRYTLND